MSPDEIAKSLVTGRMVVRELAGTDYEVTRNTMNNWVEWGMVRPWASVDEDGRTVHLFSSLEDGLYQMRRAKDLMGRYGSAKAVKETVDLEEKLKRSQRKGKR